MLRFFVVLCVALVSLVQSINIHEHMTKREILKTFRAPHDKLPEYEVVSVFHTLDKGDTGHDSTASVKVDAFERKINVYLEPNDGTLATLTTPVWTARPNSGSPENVEYTLEPNAFAGIGRAYQDTTSMSAIVAFEGEDGETLIHGILHTDIAITPLPDRLQEIISRETRSLDDSLPNLGNENFRRTHHHVVYKRQEPDMNATLKTLERHSKHQKFSNGRSKRRALDIIYPEILVIADYSLFAVLDENINETVRYLFALWNAVDLRYRLLAEPIIRLSIAGIIISLENGGTPYLDDNRRGITELDSDLAIEAMSHYFYRDSARFDFATYDMAVALTHLDMANIMWNDVYDTSTLGYAYECGACNRSHVDMNTEAVGIVEDNGGYSAIIPAAHEVAHLMGVPHDGLMETINCPAYDGYIMSTSLNVGQNNFYWSNCSLKYLHEFFSSDNATCLFNEPRTGEKIKRILPGKLMTLDEQCHKIWGTKACHSNASVCIKLECFLPGNSDSFPGPRCHGKIAAAEGSFCGDGLHCINGRCVNENATFVPYEPSTTVIPPDYGFLRGRGIFPSVRSTFMQNEVTIEGIEDEG